MTLPFPSRRMEAVRLLLFFDTLQLSLLLSILARRILPSASSTVHPMYNNIPLHSTTETFDYLLSHTFARRCCPFSSVNEAKCYPATKHPLLLLWPLPHLYPIPSLSSSCHRPTQLLLTAFSHNSHPPARARRHLGRLVLRTVHHLHYGQSTNRPGRHSAAILLLAGRLSDNDNDQHSGCMSPVCWDPWVK